MGEPSPDSTCVVIARAGGLGAVEAGAMGAAACPAHGRIPLSLAASKEHVQAGMVPPARRNVTRSGAAGVIAAAPQWH